jgi:hypothetical protein
MATTLASADDDLSDPDAETGIIQDALQRIRDVLGDGKSHFETELGSRSSGRPRRSASCARHAAA